MGRLVNGHDDWQAARIERVAAMRRWEAEDGPEPRRRRRQEGAHMSNAVAEHVEFTRQEAIRQREAPGPGWEVRGFDRSGAGFPTLPDAKLVGDLLTRDQLVPWSAYVARLEQLGAARDEVARLAVALAAADADDTAAADAAVEANAGTAPASCKPERAEAHASAIRYLHALERATLGDLEALRLALVPDWPRMVTTAWGQVADTKKRAPEVLRRGISRVEWALGLAETPSPGASETLSAFEALPLVGWDGHVGELLDALGARMAEALAAEAAEGEALATQGA